MVKPLTVAGHYWIENKGEISMSEASLAAEVERVTGIIDHVSRATLEKIFTNLEDIPPAKLSAELGVMVEELMLSVMNKLSLQTRNVKWESFIEKLEWRAQEGILHPVDKEKYEAVCYMREHRRAEPEIHQVLALMSREMSFDQALVIVNEREGYGESDAKEAD